MRPIDQHYNKTVSVERLAADAASGLRHEDYQAHLAHINCMIQPRDEGFNQDLVGAIGKDFIMFCDPADIKERDRVIDGSDQYMVTGVKLYNFRGRDHHMELTIRIFKP